jgi:signal peptidase I
MFIVFLIVVLIVAFGLQAYALKLGLRWMKVAEVPIGKALLLMLLFFVSAIPVGLVLAVVFYSANVELSGFVESTVSVILQLAVSGFVIAKMYRVAWNRGVKAVLPMTLAALGCALFLIIVVRPFVYEAFLMPTNGMAPTLLGSHLEAACPNCGRPAYGSPRHGPHGEFLPAQELEMICSHELRPVRVSEVNDKVHTGDRFLVAKYVTPKRWDIIVFDYPGDPTIKFAKRLVGLPGEEIVIRDGAVWANGKRLVPPKSIEDIEYLTTIKFAPEASAQETRPAKLGPGEYFVLGDFSAQSSDSRFWETGAPGHPPYAVPASHIIGVVINRYWPISRWHAFR